MSTPTPKWSLDHERTWLASCIARKQLLEEKVRMVRNYLTALGLRHDSFNGDGPMDEFEYREMETFCLHLIFELEGFNG